MAWDGKVTDRRRWPNGNSTALAEPDFGERGIDTSGFIGPTNIPSQPIAAPKPPKGKPEAQSVKVDESVRGLPGTANLMGFVEDIGEYDPKLMGLEGIRVYQKMRRNDATIAALELARTLPIRAANWDVVPGVDSDKPGFKLAEEIAEAAKENLFGGLERMTASGEKRTQTFESVIENALLAVMGCAAHEDIWEVDADKGRVRLARLAPRLPDTFYQFTTEPDGETLYELVQFGWRGPSVDLLPVKATKLAYFVLNREGANFYGRSIFRPCYTGWYFKQHLMKIEAVGLERNSLGIPYIELGPNASEDDKIAAWKYASNVSANERAALVLPNGFIAKLLGVEGKVLSPREAIQYYDTQILLSGLAEWLLLGQTSTGTRAVGSVQKNFFLLALESFAQMIAETITSTSLRRLIDHNYRPKPGESLPYPKLVCSDIRMVELETVLNAVKELAADNVDMLRPTAERDDAVAEMLGLPKLGKGGRGPRLAPVVTRQNLANEVIEGTGEKIDEAASANGKGGAKRTEVDTENPGKPTTKPKEPPEGHTLSETKRVPTLYVLRHVHTAFNSTTGDPQDARLRGMRNVKPDELGKKEIHEIAKQFEGKKLALVASTPLDRGLDLAKAIAAATGAPLEVWDDLRPRDYGILTGKKVREVAPILSKLQRDWDAKPKGGETLRQVWDHSKSGIERGFEAAENSDDPVAAVTHSSVVAWIPAVREGADPRGVNLETRIPPGSVIKLQKIGSDWKQVAEEPAKDVKKLLAEGRKSKVEKVPRQTLSPYWKPGQDPALMLVHPREAHVDFPGHQAQLDLAEAKIKSLLLGRKRRLLRNMATKTAEAMLAGTSLSQVAFEQPAGLEGSLRAVLEKVWRYSRDEMRAESERLEPQHVALADTSTRPLNNDPTPLLAEIAVDRYTTELGQGVRRAANNLMAGGTAELPRTAEGAIDATKLTKNDLADLLWEDVAAPEAQPGIPVVSPQLEDNVAASAVRGAFRQGRNQEAQEIIEALESRGIKVQIVRVAILDKNVCGPCEAADGKPWNLEIPVSSICEGGDLCRCEPVEVRE